MAEGRSDGKKLLLWFELRRFVDKILIGRRCRVHLGVASRDNGAAVRLIRTEAIVSLGELLVI